MAMSLALLEGSSVFAALCGAMLVWLRPLPLNWIDVVALLGQGLALSLCCIAAFYYTDLYDFRVVPSFPKFICRLPRSFGLALIPLAASSVIFFNLKIEAGSFILSLSLILALLVLIRAVFYWIMRSRLFVKRVVIVGKNPLAQKLIREIEAQPRFGYSIVAVVDDGLDLGKPPFRYPHLGSPEHLGKIIEKFHPDRIIVALPERLGEMSVRQTLLEFRVHGIVVEDGAEVYERLTGKLAIESLPSSSLIFSKDFQRSSLHLVIGGGLSLLASAVGLIVFAPIFGLIALAIKLDSQGPVLFVQKRVGLNGKPFNLLKFRTMHPVNGKTSEWARDNGDRITRVGKWLRKFRLDELPQFINILRRDMNLVGPRPHPVSNYDLFVLVLRNLPECAEQIPYYSLRTLVRPGITGWAQVRYGYANDLEEEIEKMRYDLYYIKHLSFWFDLYILLETVKVVLLGQESDVANAHWTEEHESRSREELQKAA